VTDHLSAEWTCPSYSHHYCIHEQQLLFSRRLYQTSILVKLVVGLFNVHSVHVHRRPNHI